MEFSIPKAMFGTRRIFSMGFASGVSSAVNDSLLEYLRTNAGFTVNMTGEVLQFIITDVLSAGAFADGNRVRPRKSVGGVQDVELLARFTSIAGAGVEQFLEFGIRGDETAAARSQNYNWVEIRYLTNQLSIWRMVGGVATDLQDNAFTWTAADYWVRFVAIGPLFRARAWLTTVAEPIDTWHATITDATPQSANNRGYISFGLNGGTSGAVTWTQNVAEVHAWEIGKPEIPILRKL